MILIYYNVFKKVMITRLYLLILRMIIILQHALWINQLKHG